MSPAFEETMTQGLVHLRSFGRGRDLKGDIYCGVEGGWIDEDLFLLAARGGHWNMMANLCPTCRHSVETIFKLKKVLDE